MPADVQMSAADVAYVVAWEKQTGITLNLAFNGIGACTAPTAAAESSANCTGSCHRQRGHLHRSRSAVDSSATRTTPGWSTRCWPTSPTSTGSTTPGHTCSWAAHVVAAAGAHLGHGRRLRRHLRRRHLQLRDHGGHRLRRVGALRAPAGHGRGQRVGRPDLARGHQRHRRRRHARADAGPGGGQPHRRHRLLGLRRLPGGPGLHHVRAGRPGRREPYGDRGDDLQLHRHRRHAAGGGAGLGSTFPTATNPGIDCSSAPGSWLPATSTTSPDSSHRAGDRPEPGLRGRQRADRTTPRRRS